MKNPQPSGTKEAPTPTGLSELSHALSCNTTEPGRAAGTARQPGSTAVFLQFPVTAPGSQAFSVRLQAALKVRFK